MKAEISLRPKQEMQAQDIQRGETPRAFSSRARDQTRFSHMAEVHHHRPGALKQVRLRCHFSRWLSPDGDAVQQNKKFKSRHATKSSLKNIAKGATHTQRRCTIRLVTFPLRTHTWPVSQSQHECQCSGPCSVEPEKQCKASSGAKAPSINCLEADF
jgi:hypothetical protein